MNVSNADRWTPQMRNKILQQAIVLQESGSVRGFIAALDAAQKNCVSKDRWYKVSTLASYSVKLQRMADKLTVKAKANKAAKEKPVRKEEERAAISRTVDSVLSTPTESSGKLFQSIPSPTPDDKETFFHSLILERDPWPKKAEPASPVVGLDDTLPLKEETVKPDVKVLIINTDEIDAMIKKHAAQQAKLFEEQYGEYINNRISAQVDEMIVGITAKVDLEITARTEAEFQKRLKAATSKHRAEIKFRVMIVGLIGDQVQHIKKEYGDVLNIEFVGTTEPVSRIRVLKDNCDFVLMMRKFVNHNHTEVVNFGNHKGFMMVNGGMSELSNKLLELACK